MNKKIIDVAIADNGFDPVLVKEIVKLIADDYQINFTNNYDAKYVFHSCMGNDVFKYSGIRIFVTAECVSPNFNISDYALGFDNFSFGDRYHWMPLLHLKDRINNLIKLDRSKIIDEVENKKFCAYVMSNTKNSSNERLEIFELLNSYKKVSSGGKWNNNTGGPVKNKILFQSSYKFAIAFENQSYPGYLTEKIYDAFQSNCIPIYWGDTNINDIFNNKAFINCNDYKSFEEVLDYIIKIDNDDELYKKMLSEPIFKDGIMPDSLNPENLKSFLKNIFDQSHKNAFRRSSGRWQKKIEKRLNIMANKPFTNIFYFCRYNSKKIFKKINYD